MKRTILKTIPALLILLFFTVFASASLTTSNPTLTGYVEENATGTVTITNTGTDTISDLTASNTISGYNFVETGGFASTTLTSGQSTTYQFQIFIPVTEATNLDPHTIGTITITGENSTAESVQSTSTVTLDPKSRLIITKVDIEVEGDREKVSEGERIEVRRGDSISLEIDIENDFPSSSNNDFSDVDITVDNNNLDINEDDQVDIDAGDEETVTFDFVIDNDADEGSEEIEIVASVYDDEGVYHEYIFTFDIDVDVPSRELSVDDAYFSPSIVTCEKESTLYMDLFNSGSRDLDDAMIIVTSDDDIIPSQYIKDINVDEGDDIRKTMRITLPEDTEIGNYLFYVTTYYDGSTSHDSDEQLVYIEVARCIEDTTGTSDTPDNTDDTDTTPEEIIVQQSGTMNIPTGAVFATPKKSSSFDLGLGNSAMIILLLVNLVVILAIIMVVIGMKK